MLYVDIPTAAEVRSLAAERADACVSIYLRTTPITLDIGSSRIELGNLMKNAAAQLAEHQLPTARLRRIEAAIEDLAADDDFWKYQSGCLAIFSTPDSTRTYRLPNQFSSSVHVSDRFHIAPLARTLSHPYVAAVLLLGQNDVRLIEVGPDGAAEAGKEAGVPGSLGDALGRSMPRDPAPSGRLQGAEGQKVLVRQFARKVDRAVRSYLAGTGLPLIVAAVDHVEAIYRSVNSYPYLLREPMAGNCEQMPLTEIAATARAVLSREYERQAGELRARFAAKEAAGLGMTDLADITRAATAGAVQTMLFDVECVQPGTVDEAGGVHFAAGPDASSYDIVSEAAFRVLLSGGEIIGLRAEQMPSASVAAILRFVPSA